jgi:RNA polymerase sigma-70 factor (ECF subfamily)
LSKSPENPWSSDSELVAQILSGSREHFELLYEAYFPRVYRFALKRLGDTAEAEDVAQEVFFTVFNVLGSYQGTAPLLVWVFGITRNTRVPIESLDAPEAREVAGCSPPADRALDARRMLRLCEAAIERDLTPLQRRIFHLKHLRRQSIRTIARALGKSEDAIKANLYRMRMALAESAPGLESLIAQ